MTPEDQRRVDGCGARTIDYYEAVPVYPGDYDDLIFIRRWPGR